MESVMQLNAISEAMHFGSWRNNAIENREMEKNVKDNSKSIQHHY
jgi:hypothetical protein